MAKQGNIVVDIGNSSIKSAKFIGDELTERNTWDRLDQVYLAYYSSGSFDWIFSSVGDNREEVEALFVAQNPFILTRDTPLPIQVNYDTPETLGVDRLAAAVGSHELFPGHNVLVIDAGTCITYDIVTADGTFQGGVIAPGLRMRMKAMNQVIRHLPDISGEWETLSKRSTGKSTRECLLNGSFTGIIHEMEGFLTSFMKEYGNLIVVLTGGDAVYFESNLKQPIFADQNLVLTGLNRILNYNK